MIKQNFSRQQSIIGRLLGWVPLSPNQITLLSLLFAIIAAIFIINKQILAGGALFLIAGIFDMIDGAVAREKNQATNFGGFLDGVIDRFVEACFLFALMFYEFPAVLGVPHTVWLALLIFAGTCMPSFVRAYGEHKQVIDHETAIKLGGIFERGERIIAIFAGLIIGYFLGWEWFMYIVIIAIILSLITIAQRVNEIYRRAQARTD